MRIVTILGSPRRSGNTATVLRAFERLASLEHGVLRINVVRKQVRGCLGCGACQKVLTEPGCRQRDDFPEIVGRILEADLVVYATPVYVWDFSAQMKALIDRHYCLVKFRRADPPRRLLQDKRTMLLATCGADAEHNADLLQEIFRREMDYLGCTIVGAHVVPNCTLPSSLGRQPEIVAAKMLDSASTRPSWTSTTR